MLELLNMFDIASIRRASSVSIHPTRSISVCWVLDERPASFSM